MALAGMSPSRSAPTSLRCGLLLARFCRPIHRVLTPWSWSSTREHSGRTLIHFENVDSRTSAEELRGLLLLCDVDPDARPDDPDEFYDRQLVGLNVLDKVRGPLGTVAEVVHLPGQELLAVDRPKGRQVLVPFVASIVTEVDLATGQVIVELPARPA